jgi:hypothetical protein
MRNPSVLEIFIMVITMGVLLYYVLFSPGEDLLLNWTKNLK